MIFERKPFYSNEMMFKDCERLLKVINEQEEIKTGRGKNIVITYRYKNNTPADIRKRIEDSYEHYKKLYERDMKRNNQVKFRDYQNDIIIKGTTILKQYGFLYLAMEVRTGKTLTSLGIAEQIDAERVLFITKKKAISSIESDYAKLDPPYSLKVINYESLHLVSDDSHWDLVICDEAHSMGAFPKPSNRAIAVKNIIAKYKPMVILLSGTPTPESYSQMYHQVYGIKNNPFHHFKNFYRFCDRYVDVKERKINGLMIKDYSRGKDEIVEAMKVYTINYSQHEAGFSTETKEHVLEVEMKESTMSLIKKLQKDLVVEGKEEVILGDTPVKLMMKVHQLCSGTIKFESGKSMVLDDSKARYIHDNFHGMKVGIFYKFKEELEALKQVYGDMLTTELDEFNTTDKSIALQIVSGREGISLKNAKYLVYYNIDFSATSYWQSKDRMTTIDRLENEVYWIFSKGGIEHDIYKAVTKKKDYTVQHFKKDFYENN